MRRRGSPVRDKVLGAVPGLDELLERGTPGDRVQSDALQVGAAQEAWVLWFILRPTCLVVAVPVAGLRANAVGDAVGRCNAFNADLDWSVLSIADWDGEHVATLSTRLPLLPEEWGLWEGIAGTMEGVLQEAAQARSLFADLIAEG